MGDEKALGRYIELVSPVEDGRGLPPEERLCRLAPEFPELAADSLLNPQLKGRLTEVLEGTASRLEGKFPSMSEAQRKNLCRALFETAFNLVGVEMEWAGFDEGERKEAWEWVSQALEQIESQDRGAVKGAISDMLTEMRKVLMGKSMLAKMADELESRLDEGRLSSSFLRAVREVYDRNVYYRMTKGRLTKLGNDSGTGLRRVRHMGFVQVSTNPVIAARAYEEFPELWDNFRKVAEAFPEWREDPERYADDIALHGTIVSLLPNLLIFRPFALLSDLHDGLVSYQLNPLNAENLEASVRDAERICSILRGILRHYDAWLGWDPDKLDGRPNIVFKVAVCHPVAIDITVALNERGIGTNNTVTYSVGQELRMLLAEFEGMARAIKRGILPSQVYQTNMEGRLEDHLREAVAEEFALKLDDERFEELVSALAPQAEGSRKERAREACSKKNLKSLTDERFVKVLTKAFGEDLRERLERMEEAIRRSGVYVTRRVYKLFFGSENRPKWREYLKRRFELTDEQVDTVLDRIDMLPSSKRRADDTLLVLGLPNVTNTDFPNQQLRVFQESQKEGFDLERFRNSILEEPDPEVLKVALEIEDFRKAYEITPELRQILREVGIEDGLGEGGLKPEEWPSFGPVQKTMAEFKEAYISFREKATEFVKGLGEG